MNSWVFPLNSSGGVLTVVSHPVDVAVLEGGRRRVRGGAIVVFRLTCLYYRFLQTKGFLDALERCFKPQVMRRVDQVRLAGVPPGRAGSDNNLVGIMEILAVSTSVPPSAAVCVVGAPPRGLGSQRTARHLPCELAPGPDNLENGLVAFCYAGPGFFGRGRLIIFPSPPGTILPSINTAVSIDRNPRV